MKFQKGGTVVGLIVGLLMGLLIALGVVLYVNKIPVPFMNKVPTHTAEQDAAEAKKNQNWDPNAPLYGKNPAVPHPVASGVAEEPADGASGAASGAASGVPASAPASSAKDPMAILEGKPASGAVSTEAPPEPFIYYVQAGAFARVEEAEQQRGKLALLGLEPRVSEREQAGRTVYRVRLGPFDRRAEADEVKAKLASNGVESAMVRVQR